jgi:hypothetical protein
MKGDKVAVQEEHRGIAARIVESLATAGIKAVVLGRDVDSVLLPRSNDARRPQDAKWIGPQSRSAWACSKPTSGTPSLRLKLSLNPSWTMSIEEETVDLTGRVGRSTPQLHSQLHYRRNRHRSSAACGAMAPSPDTLAQ